jgi:Protein of unknown function (DUF3309)
LRAAQKVELAKTFTVESETELLCRADVCLHALFAWKTRGNTMLGTILIIILILLLIGALPTWPYSSGWGYYPGGGIGLILVIIIILALLGRI